MRQFLLSLAAVALTLAAGPTATALDPAAQGDPPPPPWQLPVTANPDPRGGMVITSVIPGSPAERIGLEVGDVITEVNGRPTRIAREMDDAVRNSRGYLRLRIVDVRTGASVIRGLNLNS
jgi:S1-C subfamily serine protease